MDDQVISPLERLLLDTPSYHFTAVVRELDVLRDVLLGRCGTDAQRNVLLRIIKAHADRPRLTVVRLCAQFGEPVATHVRDSGTFAGYERQFRPNQDPQILRTNDTEDEDDEDDEDDGI